MTPELIRSQRTKVTDIGHVEVIVSKKLIGISLDPNAEESNIRVFQEGIEGTGNVRRVDNLEDEAGVTHAELEGGYGVLRVRPSVGSPLNVQAHHESMTTAGVSGEPRGDFGGVGCDQGVDVVGFESDVVQVVGVVAEVVVHHVYSRHGVGTVAHPNRHTVSVY